MNERIKELAEQAYNEFVSGWSYTNISPIFSELRDKFAELLIQECIENFSKVWYEQGMDVRGADLGKFLTRFKERFGVE